MEERLAPQHWLILILSALGLSACLAKTPGAVDAPEDTSSAVLTSCPAAESFRMNAEPVLQQKCVTCHAAGGRGAGDMLLLQESGDELLLAKNYTTALSFLLADDQGNLDLNTILSNSIGNNGHDRVLSVTDDEYAGLRQWVSDERDTPCGSEPAPDGS